MQDAIITATVTDANNCTYTVTSSIHAEDVRCFAGNSNIAKVTICHKTGSAKNPCVTICVDQSAVAEHLAHGDFLGTCTANCTAPNLVKTGAVTAPIAISNMLSTLPAKLEANVMPNPTTTVFNLVIRGKDASPVTVRVTDVYGKVIQVNQKIGSSATLRLGDRWTNGTYFVEVIQGNERKLLKVIKAN